MYINVPRQPTVRKIDLAARGKCYDVGNAELSITLCFGQPPLNTAVFTLHPSRPHGTAATRKHAEVTFEATARTRRRNHPRVEIFDEERTFINSLLDKPTGRFRAPGFFQAISGSTARCANRGAQKRKGDQGIAVSSWHPQNQIVMTGLGLTNFGVMKIQKRAAVSLFLLCGTLHVSSAFQLSSSIFHHLGRGRVSNVRPVWPRAGKPAARSAGC